MAPGTQFFTLLYTSLARGARAVLQFYPESPAQVEMITTSAMRAGFSGGLVIDYPNSSKRKKYFLCLFAGMAPDRPNELPQGLSDDGPTVENVAERYARGYMKHATSSHVIKLGGTGPHDWRLCQARHTPSAQRAQGTDRA